MEGPETAYGALGPGFCAMGCQEIAQLAHGTRTVRKTVLDLYPKFCKGLPSLFGRKHRVIAEAVGTKALGGDVAIDLSLEKVFAAVENQGDHRAETCRTVRNALKLSENLVDVGFRIVTVGEGIAGSMHAGAPVERGDFKPRIIGKDIQSITFIDITGLLERISLKRIGRFGNVVVTIYVGKTKEFHLIAKYGSDFREFVGIVGSKNNFHCVSIHCFCGVSIQNLIISHGLSRTSTDDTQNYIITRTITDVTDDTLTSGCGLATYGMLS